MKSAFVTALLGAVFFSSSAFALTQLSDKELSTCYGVATPAYYKDIAQIIDPNNAEQLGNGIFYIQQQIFNTIFSYDETIIGRVDNSVTTTEIVNGELHVHIAMDQYTAEIIISNIRPAGSDPNGPSFGTLTINDMWIRSTIDLTYHN